MRNLGTQGRLSIAGFPFVVLPPPEGTGSPHMRLRCAKVSVLVNQTNVSSQKMFTQNKVVGNHDLSLPLVYQINKLMNKPTRIERLLYAWHVANFTYAVLLTLPMGSLLSSLGIY